MSSTMMRTSWACLWSRGYSSSAGMSCPLTAVLLHDDCRTVHAAADLDDLVTGYWATVSFDLLPVHSRPTSRLFVVLSCWRHIRLPRPTCICCLESCRRLQQTFDRVLPGSTSIVSKTFELFLWLFADVFAYSRWARQIADLCLNFVRNFDDTHSIRRKLREARAVILKTRFNFTLQFNARRNSFKKNWNRHQFSMNLLIFAVQCRYAVSVDPSICLAQCSRICIVRFSKFNNAFFTFFF